MLITLSSKPWFRSIRLQHELKTVHHKCIRLQTITITTVKNNPYQIWVHSWSLGQDKCINAFDLPWNLTIKTTCVTCWYGLIIDMVSIMNCYFTKTNIFVPKWVKFNTVIRSNGLCLCKIPSLMSQFSTNQRTFSLFSCFLSAVFNNCWSTTPNF